MLLEEVAPIEASVAVSVAVEAVPESWDRPIHEDDMRQVIARWRRDGWIRDYAAPPARLLLTDLGWRSLRAVARAAGGV